MFPSAVDGLNSLDVVRVKFHGLHPTAVERRHDGMFVLGVLQAQRMTDLVDRRLIYKEQSVVSNIFNL